MSTRTRLSDLLDDFRQPEYIGENRCLPCTVTNVTIAAVMALGLAVALVTPIGVLAFLVSLGVIYLRGYLVPGTPEFTQEYFPAWLLALFGKDAVVQNTFDVSSENLATETTTGTIERNGATERNRSTVSATTATAVGTEIDSDATKLETVDGTEAAVEATDTASEGPLFAASVVTREASDEVVLTPSFSEAWCDRIATVREQGVEPADVKAIFDAEAIKRTGDLSFVIDGNASVRWESRASLVADVAAAALCRERLAHWSESEKDDRTATLTGLRLFLAHCPICDGAITHDDDRVDPCCQKPHLVATATCGECDSLIADAAVVDSGEGSSVRVRLLRP